MKLLVFCNIAPQRWGAFESLLAAINYECDSAGDRMHVVFGGNPSKDVADRLQRDGIEWEVILGWDNGKGGTRPWRFCLPATRIIRRIKPDVVAVHFGNEIPSVVALLLSRILAGSRIRWIWHQRQQIKSPNIATRHVSRLRLASLAFDHFVASYEGGKSSLLARGIKADRISVIYNSIGPFEPAKEKGWLRRELGISSNSVVVINVGWLVPRKRTHISITAFEQALRMLEADAHLIVVGSGPNEPALRKQSDQSLLKGKVHFLGERNDVRDVLAECDILVHSSEAETCTNVVQEAMSVSVPTVMTDAGAAHEQIEDGISGFVVPRDDTDGLAARLALLMKDCERRIRQGKMAKRRWEKMFQLSASATAHHCLYHAIVVGKELRSKAL
ncbi:MAG: glycosyltransferase [Lentisphaerae bacterium]|nr:glycosyltransferase [Lentisphaerota bacterium]